MSNPEVKAARQDKAEAKVDAKVAKLRDDAASIRGESPTTEEAEGASAADALASVSASGGVVTIQTANGPIRVISEAQYRQDMTRIREGATRMKAFFRAMPQTRHKLARYIDRQVDEAVEAIRSQYERQNGHADAFSEFHGEAAGYRDDLTGIIGMLTAPLSAFISTVNREDAANTSLLALAESIKAYPVTQSGSKSLLNFFALLAEMFAFYDPATGFASIFTQQQAVVRVPVGTAVPAAAAAASISFG